MSNVASITNPVKQAEKTASAGQLEKPVRPARKSATSYPTPKNYLAWFNALHAVIIVGGKTKVLNEECDYETCLQSFTLSDFRDFKNRYSPYFEIIQSGDRNKKILVADMWLEDRDRRQFEGIIFDPEHPGHGSHYNLFQGFSFKPAPGDCSLFKKLMLEVICSGNQNHFEYLWNWTAHLFQKPWELPGVAVVMRGKQGTGKGTFATILGKMIGNHFKHIQQHTHLVGHFNGHMESALLVFADEVTWGGRSEETGFLKATITEHKQQIEKKGQDVYSVDNFKRLIIASNEAWCAPVEIGDRRFFVLNVNDQHVQDQVFFAALLDQMAAGGINALMHELMHTDLSGFNVRAKPDTQGNDWDMKLRGADSVTQWLFEYLDRAHGDDFDLKPVKTDLHQGYLEWCEQHDKRHPSVDSMFAKRLKEVFNKVGNYLSDGRHQINGKQCRVWEFPELDTAKRCFEEAVGGDVTIWQHNDSS